MSEKMYPIPFRSLMNWVITEYAGCGDVFGIENGNLSPGGVRYLPGKIRGSGKYRIRSQKDKSFLRGAVPENL